MNKKTAIRQWVLKSGVSFEQLKEKVCDELMRDAGESNRIDFVFTHEILKDSYRELTSELFYAGVSKMFKK